MKKIFVFFAILLQSSLLFSQSALNVPFVKNSGILNDNVSFFIKTYAGNVLILNTSEIIYKLKSAEFSEKFDLESVDVEGVEQNLCKINLLYSADKKKWHTGITTFNSLQLNSASAPVHILLRAESKNFEKIFKFKKNFPLETFSISLKNIDSLSVDNGELIIFKNGNEVKFSKPLAYQFIDGEKVFYEAEYTVAGKTSYTFHVKGYDKSLPLFIDPLLVSVYIGGTEEDIANDITSDSNGNIYITGSTLSSYFPTGKYGADKTINGAKDVFVCKLDKNLQILSATFIGGTKNDIANSIAVDKNGNVFVTGETFSSDFPVVYGAVKPSFSGVSDAFVVKLNSSLTSFLAGTFLGGSYEDIGKSIYINSNGCVIVGGETDSSDFFPVASNGYDTIPNGYRDIFAVKLNSELSLIGGATFLGEEYEDYMGGIAVDSNDNIYVAGANVKKNGYEDFTIYKLSSDLSQLKISKSFSGKYDDFPTDIKINNENVFVAGFTQSNDFSVTSGSFDSLFNGGAFDKDGFLLKTDLELNLLASTFIGGNSYDIVNKICFGADGGIYVTGVTKSSNFPVIAGAYDESINGYKDIFISKFSPDLKNLSASTFLGGGLDDFGNSVTVDMEGNVYVTGFSESNNFPVTGSDVYKGNDDVVVAKLTSNLSLSVMPDGQFFNLSFSSSGEWKLCSLPLDTSLNVEKFSSVKTVWKWKTNEKAWEIWSPLESLKNLVSQYGMSTFSFLEPGEGFWINSDKDVSYYLSGIDYGVEKFTITSGWNLAGAGKTINVAELYAKEPNIKTVWVWNNGSWKIWSPDDSINSLVSQYGMATFSLIEKGQGFWINR